MIDLEIQRADAGLVVRLVAGAPSGLRLESHAPGSTTTSGSLRIPLPAVEVGISNALPEPGAVTSQLKVLDQHYSPHSLTLRLSAAAGSTQTLFLRVNEQRVRVRSSDLSLPVTQQRSSNFQVVFPQGTGYVEKTITLNW
jgi:hypothetical protein